jgi:hypothetical protein
MPTKAQRAAQARYDQTRPGPVPVRMNAAELARLDALRQPGEGRGPALLRLAKIREETEMQINKNGPWRLYAPVLPPSAEPLGTVTRAPGDVGALVRFTATGVYAQANAGAIRSLDQRAVAKALDK